MQSRVYIVMRASPGLSERNAFQKPHKTMSLELMQPIPICLQVKAQKKRACTWSINKRPTLAQYQHWHKSLLLSLSFCRMMRWLVSRMIVSVIVAAYTTYCDFTSTASFLLSINSCNFEMSLIRTNASVTHSLVRNRETSKVSSGSFSATKRKFIRLPKVLLHSMQAF